MEAFRLAQRKTFAQLLHNYSTSTSLNARQRLSRQQPRLLRNSGPRQVKADLSSRSFSTTSGATLRGSAATGFSHSPPSTSIPHPLQSFRRSVRAPRSRRNASSSSSTPPQSDANLSLSQRFKKLSREYGWSALGVYLLLTALDFPFCFLAVRLIGTERIGHAEHVVLHYLKEAVKWPMAQLGLEAGTQGVEAMSQEAEKTVREDLKVQVPGVDGTRLLDESSTGFQDHGVVEADKANRGEGASIWTQLALAYAIHKSFIFVRVPVTIAITPRVVKTLRGWGWNIGKRTPKTGSTATAVRGDVKSVTGTGVKAERGTGINTGSKQ